MFGLIVDPEDENNSLNETERAFKNIYMELLETKKSLTVKNIKYYLVNSNFDMYYSDDVIYMTEEEIENFLNRNNIIYYTGLRSVNNAQFFNENIDF